VFFYVESRDCAKNAFVGRLRWGCLQSSHIIIAGLRRDRERNEEGLEGVEGEIDAPPPTHLALKPHI